MRTLISMLAAALAPAVQAAPQEPVWALAQKEKPAVVETLRDLVNIESGSRDKEGLDRLAVHLGERLAALGAKVEFYEPNATDTYRLFDTPKEIGKVVVARFQGSGARRIMLLAHMDTVYPRGRLAKRPFRVEGARPTARGSPTTRAAARSSCLRWQC
jgi:glutamate carboxypeptidase